jgi:hypothetical protein
MRESRAEAVRVPDVSYSTYRALLDYLLSDYLAEGLEIETTLELMMLANAYGIARLEQICARSLASRLDASNVLEVARCAAMIGEHHLRRAADKFAAGCVAQNAPPPAPMLPAPVRADVSGVTPME